MVNRCFFFSNLMVALIFATLLAASTPLPATAQEVHTFQVAAPDAASAIRAFSAQSGLQILAAGEDLAGKQLNSVTGVISNEQALNALLAGTGLEHRYIGDHSVALVAADSSGGSGAAAANTATEQRDYKIPAGNLNDALKAFAAQSGVSVSATTAVTAAQKTRGARGKMTADEALRRLLKQSGLHSVNNADGSVTIAIADADPGIANWLNTCGHAQGCMMFRWTKAERIIDPRVALVKLRAIDLHSVSKRWPD